MSYSCVAERNEAMTVAAQEKKDIQILIGIIRLICGKSNHTLSRDCHVTGPYLVVGTQHRLVGSIEGHQIYEMTHYDIIPFIGSTLHLTQSQVSY